MIRTSRVALAAALVVVAGCSGGTSVNQGGGFYGTLPLALGPVHEGGVVRVAETPGAGPNWIFPITPAAQSSLYTINEFQDLFWRPLFWSPVGASPQINYPLSLVSGPPVYSRANTTVTINLRKNYMWSDGSPVQARDVVFFFDLLRAAIKESPANAGTYSPGFFPDTVKSAVATSRFVVTISLTKAFNPGWFTDDELALLYALPSTRWDRGATGTLGDWASNAADAKKIYDYLAKQSRKLSSYAANPLWQDVDGPYHLAAFNPTNGAAVLKPNPAYTGPQKSHVAEVDLVPFGSAAAEFQQLLNGTLDVGFLDFAHLGQAPALRRSGYQIYGLPAFGFYYMPFNFSDQTGHFNAIIRRLYVRQALAHLVDQRGYISGPFDNAAVPGYGPVPSVPSSPYTPANATRNPYPFVTTQPVFVW